MMNIYIYIYMFNSECTNRQGQIRISQRGGGGCGKLLSTKMRHIRVYTRDVFSPLYEVWGSPLDQTLSLVLDINNCRTHVYFRHY